MATKRTTRTNSWLWTVAAIAGTLFLCLCMLTGLVLTGVLNPGYKVVSVNEVAPVVEPRATPQTEGPANHSDVVFLIGGRLDEGKKGYESVAVASMSLVTDGTPLQQHFSQVTDNNFANTLNLPAEHEVFNDWLQFVVVGNTTYIMPREDSSVVPFHQISWMKYIPNQGVQICYDDAGASGDWIGACAGSTQMVTSSMPTEQLLASALFKPWAEQFVKTKNSFDGTIFNDRLELLVTFRATK